MAELTSLGLLTDGRTSDPAEFHTQALLLSLWSRLVGPRQPVRSAQLTATQPFFAASAVSAPGPGAALPRLPTERTTGGTANTASMALVKAISEAYERYAGSLVRVDVTASARELAGPWLDPRLYAPLTAKQDQRLPELQPFDEAITRHWVYGLDVHAGTPTLVPADLTFFPLDHASFSGPRGVYANSSGVAAFTDEPGAMERALLELIERDALMRCWFGRRPPPCINPSQLSGYAQDRRRHWQSLGRDTHVLDLSGHGVPTVLVAIVSDTQYPCLSTGASSSLTSFEEALAKAWHEAESGLLDALHSPQTRRISPAAVARPFDHAKLYYYPDHLDHVRWLWDSRRTVPPEPPAVTFGQLLAQLRPTMVRLSPPDAPLVVVRMLSDQLVPINFGHGTEYYTHRSLYRTLDPTSLQLPHFFA
jgi:thiazole/oxazole-forming peptide maturase SagD family component